MATGTDCLQRIEGGERINALEAMALVSLSADELCTLADARRKRLHGEVVHYNRNFHFEPTNLCVYECAFCAFARPIGSTKEQGAWDHDLSRLQALLDLYPPGSITEVHITGGVHPDRGTEFGENLCRFIRERRPEIHIKAFTAVEIAFFARRTGITVEQCLFRLREAGLGSLPGGGAEIFDHEVRRIIAGGKAPAHRWLEVHRTAHAMGIPSNATMLYGHLENWRHRIDHMERLRDLQDEHRGFMAFIPLRFRNENNALSHLNEIDGDEERKVFAIARIFLDNIPHLKAYWVMLGVRRAVDALSWGVDDLDGTIDDTTRIYSMAGAEDEHPRISADDLCRLICEAGRLPVERDSLFRPRTNGKIV